MTFVFPDSLSNVSPRTAPLANAVPMPDNTSARLLPSTSNPFSPISQDTTLAFSVPFDEVSDLLAAVQEIPNEAQTYKGLNPENARESKRWVMKYLKNNTNGSRSSLGSWAADAWTEFVDLLKVCHFLYFSPCVSN